MGKLISIIGNSGVGKTTLARALATFPGYTLGLEDHAGRPFQELFRCDARRFALANQVDYLLLRAEQERSLRQDALAGVQDGGLDLDFHVFTVLFHRKGFLSAEEFDLCRRLYEELRLSLPEPDLFVYLKAPLSLIRERFIRRSRPLEIAGVDDLPAIQELLDAWVALLPGGAPLLEIETGQADPGFTRLLPGLLFEIDKRLFGG